MAGPLTSAPACLLSSRPPEGVQRPLDFLRSRTLARHIHAMLKGGVSLVTVYLEPGVQVSGLNLWLIEALATFCLGFDGPQIGALLLNGPFVRSRAEYARRRTKSGLRGLFNFSTEPVWTSWRVVQRLNRWCWLELDVLKCLLDHKASLACVARLQLIQGGNMFVNLRPVLCCRGRRPSRFEASAVGCAVLDALPLLFIRVSPCRTTGGTA